MSVQEIPLKPATAQRFSITLGTVEYRVTMKWNTVSECWVADLSTAEGAALLSGVPIVTGADLFQQFRYLGVGGTLAALSDDDPDAVPTFENLGRQGHLYYQADE